MSTQFVIARESTYGGSLVSQSTRGVEAMSDGLNARLRRVPRTGLRAGAGLASAPYRMISDGGEGTVEAALVSNGLQPLLSAFFGTSAVTTPGGATLARLHTFTDVNGPAGESIYMQKVVEQEDGTDGGIFTFKGCVSTGLTFTQGVGDGDQTYAKVSANIDAKQVLTNVSKATATYRTVGDVFTYETCTVTLGGDVPCANDFTLTLDKNLDVSKRCLDTAEPRHAPSKAGFAGVTGQFTVQHAGNDLYDLWAAGTPVDLVIDWTSTVTIESTTAYQLTITIPEVTLDGDTPMWNIGTSGTQTVKLIGSDNLTDEPVTVELVTTDTAL